MVLPYFVPSPYTHRVYKPSSPCAAGCRNLTPSIVSRYLSMLPNTINFLHLMQKSAAVLPQMRHVPEYLIQKVLLLLLLFHQNVQLFNIFIRCPDLSGVVVEIHDFPELHRIRQPVI